MAKLRLLPSTPTYTRNPKVLPEHLIKIKTPAKAKAKASRAYKERQMKSIGAETLKTIAEGMNAGYIYVDNDGIIGDFSELAKEILGIKTSGHQKHDAGRIEPGDIVIFADNDLGNDDMMRAADLECLNIKDKDISQGDIVLAVGRYKDRSAKPVYKTFGGYVPEPVITLQTKLDGLEISISIDCESRSIKVTVAGEVYGMDYLESVGHLVVLDGKTKEVKFFQAKGYGYRGEEAGEILRGKGYQSKNIEDKSTELVPTVGMSAGEVLKGKEFQHELATLLSAEDGAEIQKVLEIYRRWMLVKMMRIKKGTKDDGVYIFIRDRELAQKAARAGAVLKEKIENASRLTAYKDEVAEIEFLKNIVGNSVKMQKVKQLAYKAANTRFNVIITGESGTGKTKLAREIHSIKGENTPFVTVACNAIAPSLIESELFGYVPGAFTGADAKGKKGFFEEANGGTIFLDEIGEIPPEMQIKLLNVLQDKRIYRVGSTKPIDIDVRVITASNRNLEEEVKKGRFRQDLYYRINVFPISLPPLRERKKDLRLLAESILRNLLASYGMDEKKFAEEAMEIITAYDWPGNVRELENIIERAITLCDGTTIYAEHLMISKLERQAVSLKARVEAGEKKIIEEVLIKHNGNRKKAMQELELSKSVFYDKVKRYGIELE